MNGAQYDYGSGRVRPPGLKITQFRHNAECVLFWEAMEQLYQGQALSGAVWNDGSSYPTEEVMADRHYKGANVAFLDGHAEWWTQDVYNYHAGLPITAKFPAVADPTQPSQLWCSPLQPNGGGTIGTNRGG
jgi:prepilin-type processing-associated H-X9-DG protein